MNVLFIITILAIWIGVFAALVEIRSNNRKKIEKARDLGKYLEANHQRLPPKDDINTPEFVSQFDPVPKLKELESWWEKRNDPPEIPRGPHLPAYQHTPLPKERLPKTCFCQTDLSRELVKSTAGKRNKQLTVPPDPNNIQVDPPRPGMKWKPGTGWVWKPLPLPPAEEMEPSEELVKPLLEELVAAHRTPMIVMDNGCQCGINEICKICAHSMAVSLQRSKLERKPCGCTMETYCADCQPKLWEADEKRRQARRKHLHGKNCGCYACVEYDGCRCEECQSRQHPGCP